MRDTLPIDSLCAMFGGAFAYFGNSIYASLSHRLDSSAIKTVLEAEQQSILEIHIQLTDALYVTPGDCLQIIGAIVGLTGFISMIVRKAKAWHKLRNKS